MILPCAATARIGVDEQESGYLFRVFSDSDHVHVRSHYGNYGLALENGWSLNIDYNNERVVIPAVEAPPGSADAVDAITTASRPISGDNAYEDFVKYRNEVQGDIRIDRATLGYYVSSESDYFAQLLRGGFDQDFFGQQLNVAFGASYGWDAIDPIQDDDTAGESDDKTSVHFNTVVTQILTSTTVVRVGAEMTVVRGLQHNPYRNVYAEGGNVAEHHPNERRRRDVFVNVNQYLRNRSSLRGSFRYYSDDWGVTSQTAGVKLSQYITDLITARYRYRFYTQSSADFYRDEYASASGVDGYLTGDYRLGELTSHLFGSRLDVNLGVFDRRNVMLRRLDLSVGFERYFNSNNFSANVFETGLQFRF